MLHARLTRKLPYYGVNGEATNWISYWLTNRKQKMVVDGESSEEEAVLDPLISLIFLLYVNDKGEGSTSNMCADDGVVYRCVNKPNDADALQSDVKRPVDWSATRQKRFHILRMLSDNTFVSLSVCH